MLCQSTLGCKLCIIEARGQLCCAPLFANKLSCDGLLQCCFTPFKVQFIEKRDQTSSSSQELNCCEKRAWIVALPQCDAVPAAPLLLPEVFLPFPHNTPRHSAYTQYN
eukprot:383967-Pelagomonas_calceolata.AAC.3